MSDRKKVLFVDLDGTLLNDEKKITPGNAAAISEALAEGHKIVINTGRASASALQLAKSLGLNREGCYAITFNGGCICDLHQEKALYRVSIPREYVRHLLDEARKLGVQAHTYGETEVLSETDNEDLQIYLKNTSMTARIVPDVCKVLREDPCKVLIADYACTGLLSKYRERISGWAEGKVDHFYSCRELLEIVPPGVSKKNAIPRLLSYLHLSIEDTVSAGDADNDIPMLQATQVGVVMKNAAPHMHQYGTYITENDNNHDGIEEVIRKFILV